MDFIYVPGYYKERKRSMQARKRAEMAARVKVRIDPTIMPPRVPCSNMEVEGLGQGENTDTDGGVNACEQPFKAYVTNVIHGEDIDNSSNL